MVRTITIKDDVYLLLVSLKRENESFSDLLKRLAEKEISSIDLLIRAAEKVNLEISKEDKEEFLKEIERERRGR